MCSRKEFFRVSNSGIVKLADFGRGVVTWNGEYYSKGGPLPIRWLAPETITDGRFSFASDIVRIVYLNLDSL